MIEYPPERFETDPAFADMFMPVHTRAQRRLRIVHVNHGDPVESNRAANILQRGLQALSRAQIPPGGKQVGRIDADAQRQFRACVDDSLQLFEARPHRGALPRRILEKQLQIAELQSSRRLLQPLRDRSDCLVHAAIRTATSRVRHQIVRAEGNRAHKLLMEGLHGSGAQHGIRGREVDQVIVVNGERTQCEFFSPLSKPRGI